MCSMLQGPFYLHIHVVNMGLPDMETRQPSPVHTSLLHSQGAMSYKFNDNRYSIGIGHHN